MKPTFKAFTIEVASWNARVIVMLGGTDTELNRVMTANGVGAETADGWIEHVAASRKTGGGFTMFSPDQPWQALIYHSVPGRDLALFSGAIAHEIFHAATAILRQKLTPLQQETEEVYAYLIEFLTREFWKKVAP